MIATRPISSYDDIIDSRDVIARIEELAEWVEPLTDEEETELAALRALAAEGRDATADWEDGATLVQDSYFVEYAQELADDLGYTDGGTVSWPFTCIDWEKAAWELQMDYTAVEFDGVTYWVR
jgi:hypothetical protein